MKDVTVTIDWVLITGKLIVLFILLLCSQVGIKEMLRGTRSANYIGQTEFSVFVVVLISFCFDFLGRFLSEGLLTADLSAGAKRQLYYLLFAVHELLCLVLIIHLHERQKLSLTRHTRIICYLIATTITMVAMRFLDRVIFETNFLGSVYTYFIVLINTSVVLVMMSYALSKAIRRVSKK